MLNIVYDICRLDGDNYTFQLLLLHTSLGNHGNSLRHSSHTIAHHTVFPLPLSLALHFLQQNRIPCLKHNNLFMDYNINIYENQSLPIPMERSRTNRTENMIFIVIQLWNNISSNPHEVDMNM